MGGAMEKPADFFIGVIEFFSVLLPGAVVTAVIRPTVAPLIFGARGFLPPFSNPTQDWIAFVVAAYLLGSVLFLCGSFLDSFLYDQLRKAAVPVDRDGLYHHATSIKERVLPSAVASEVNTFQWAKATLRLQSANAISEIERFEADSKFFRSLTVAAFALLLVALGARGLRTGSAAYWTPFAAAIAIPFWLLAAPRKPVKRKPRDVVIGAIIFTVVVALFSVINRDWKAVALIVFFVLAVWRYGERRWKSTRTAYTYSTVWYEQSAPTPAVRVGGGSARSSATAIADTLTSSRRAE